MRWIIFTLLLSMVPSGGHSQARWERIQRQDPMTDETRSLATLTSDQPITVGRRASLPSLVLGCIGSKIVVAVGFDAPLRDDARGIHFSRFRFDNEPAKDFPFFLNENGKALQFSAAPTYLRRIRTARRLRVEANSIFDGPLVADFDLAGASSEVDFIASACRIDLNAPSLPAQPGRRTPTVTAPAR